MSVCKISSNTCYTAQPELNATHLSPRSVPHPHREAQMGERLEESGQAYNRRRPSGEEGNTPRRV